MAQKLLSLSKSKLVHIFQIVGIFFAVRTNSHMIARLFIIFKNNSLFWPDATHSAFLRITFIIIFEVFTARLNIVFQLLSNHYKHLKLYIVYNKIQIHPFSAQHTDHSIVQLKKSPKGLGIESLKKGTDLRNCVRNIKWKFKTSKWKLGSNTKRKMLVWPFFRLFTFHIPMGSCEWWMGYSLYVNAFNVYPLVLLWYFVFWLWLCTFFDECFHFCFCYFCWQLTMNVGNYYCFQSAFHKMVFLLHCCHTTHILLSLSNKIQTFLSIHHVN